MAPKIHPPLLFFLLLTSGLTFKGLLQLAESEGKEFSWLGDEGDDDFEAENVQTPFSRCDFSVGKWILDSSNPLYKSDCPYINPALACRLNGRPDSGYQNWRWKPTDCFIPRFNASIFLGRMRRKKIVLVGDSIMRSQWESLVCMVQGVLPTGKKTLTYNKTIKTFYSADFEMAIEFQWAPLLVEIKTRSDQKKILHLDLIEENAKYWRGADVLVFDSAHWWTQSQNSWNYYMVGNKLYDPENIDPMSAYQKALTTWANWVDSNLDSATTRIIFRSMSPRHNRQNGWKCYNKKSPLMKFSHPHVAKPVAVLKRVLLSMPTTSHVYYMDITTMSAFRIDGHPSVYNNKDHLYSDCSHWCLPGVVDSWNEILSAILEG